MSSRVIDGSRGKIKVELRAPKPFRRQRDEFYSSDESEQSEPERKVERRAESPRPSPSPERSPEPRRAVSPSRSPSPPSPPPEVEHRRRTKYKRKVSHKRRRRSPSAEPHQMKRCCREIKRHHIIREDVLRQICTRGMCKCQFYLENCKNPSMFHFTRMEPKRRVCTFWLTITGCRNGGCQNEHIAGLDGILGNHVGYISKHNKH